MRVWSPAPLRERNFRLLFTAQAVWLLGSWMTPVALAFAVLDLTDSPTALGLVLGAEAVPLVALLLPVNTSQPATSWTTPMISRIQPHVLRLENRNRPSKLLLL